MNSNNSDYRPSEIITIKKDQAGQRIDNFLFTYLKGIPKTRIYKMLRKGEVRVNKGRIKPVYRLKPDDMVRLPPVKLEMNKPKVSANLNQVKVLEERIIYESNRLLIINKPSGIAVHGGSGDSYGVIEALRSLRPDAQYLELVHRLDKLTSGCLMIAKKRSTLRYLHEQLREHRIQKTYQAWVWGHWPEQLTEIDEPILTRRFANGDRKSVVDPDGKSSKTLFKCLKRTKKLSLIEAKPKTGRMHQIRVHCAWAGHPICGDSKYLKDESLVRKHKRLYLHAQRLKFKERPDADYEFVTAISDSFEQLLTA